MKQSCCVARRPSVQRVSIRWKKCHSRHCLTGLHLVAAKNSAPIRSNVSYGPHDVSGRPAEFCLMFTGIVTDVGEVRSVNPRAENLHRVTILCGYPLTEIV